MIEAMSPYFIPIAGFIGFALSAVWLVFFLLEDREQPEPAYMITKTFILGICGALFAAIIEKIFSIASGFFGIATNSIPDLFGNSAIEEVVKFLIVLCFISRSKWFDEPVDRMIYMITCALGFAAVENFLFLASASNFADMTGIWLLRFIGATLMHALASAVVGYSWANKKILIGISGAVLIHAVFNYLVLKSGPAVLPVVFLSGISFIVFHEFDIIKQKA